MRTVSVRIWALAASTTPGATDNGFCFRMRRTSGVTVEALEVVSSAIKIPLILGGGSGDLDWLAAGSGLGCLYTLLRSRLRILTHRVQYRLNIRQRIVAGLSYR